MWDKKINIKINKDRIDKEYWIDTNGKIYKYDGDLSEEICSIHAEIANKIYPNSNRPTDILFNLGWIMVGSTVYNTPIIHKNPTQSQINKLNELGLFDRFDILCGDYYINYKEYIKQ